MNTDTLEYKLGHNGRFEMPAAPFDTTNPPEPALYFKTLLAHAEDHLLAQQAIASDRVLSDYGREQKLLPLLGALADKMAHAFEGMDSFGHHLAKTEAELMAVATPVTPFEIAQQAEVRGWWRSMSNAERLSCLERMQADPAGYAPVIAALLNSPIPSDLHGHEQTFVRDLHRKTREAERPDLAIKLEDGRAAKAWAERGLNHLRGIIGKLTPLNDRALLERFASRENGAAKLKALGFDAKAIERAVQAATRKKAV